MTIYLLSFITVLVLLSYFYFIGLATESVFGFQNNKTVTGFFIYFSIYGVLSIPLASLHVSWFVFSTSISLLNIALLGISFYLLRKKNIKIIPNKEKIMLFFKKNWPIILLITVYFGVYLMSSFSLNWYLGRGAVWDQSYYAAKANAAIDSSNILLINPKYGYVEPPMASLVNSSVTWELLWSYISSLTGLTVNQVSKLVFPVIIFTVVFFTIEQIIKSFFKENSKFYRSYTIFFWFNLVYTTFNDGLKDELTKFMYLPWYGNVLVTMLFFLTTAYFFAYALKDKKGILLLFIQLIFYNVFSAGGLMYAALIYPFFIIYWLFNKKYVIKFEKLLVLFSLLFLIGLNLFYIISQKNVRWVEQEQWLSFFQLISPVFVLASFGYLFLYKEQRMNKFNTFIFIYIVAGLLLLVIEPFSGIVFNYYKFALHRFGLSLLLIFILCGSIGFVSIFEKNKKILLITLIPLLILFQKNYDFYFVQNKDGLKPSNILNTARESKEVVEVADFLNQKAALKKQPVYYCVYTKNAYRGIDSSKRTKTKYYETYIDIGSMILTETKNVFESYNHDEDINEDIPVSKFKSSNCNYLLTDIQTLKSEYEADGFTVEKTIRSETLLSEFYIIKIKE